VQRVVHAADRGDVSGVPLQNPAHNVYDRNEGKFSRQEPLHGDLVGGVEDRRHRSPGPECLVGETDRGETACIDRQELQIADLREIEARERRFQRMA
jgi:hypothetical protein